MRSSVPELSLRGNPWSLSVGIHGALLLAAGLVAAPYFRAKPETVDFEVYENPVTAARPVHLEAPPKPAEPANSRKPRAVFGSSRKAITSAEGIGVKAGNTVAKAPDQETLQPSDADALPVPADEYLVTRMPELVSEVRVPYTAEAKKNGIQGTVLLDILVDGAGVVRDVKLLEGPGYGLNEAAAEAVRRFKFRGAQMADRPVAVRLRYAYRFVLER